MRALSSGVAIIACGEGEARLGCTVTSLASLSLAPPTLIVCLARSSSTLAGLRATGAFSISLLAARHQALAHRFSAQWTLNRHRSTLIAAACVVWFLARLSGRVRASPPRSGR